MTGRFSADVQRCADMDAVHRTTWQLFADSFGLQALLAYRLGRWLLAAGRKFYLWPLLPAGWAVYYVLSRYVRIAYGIRLELSADIGPGFYIGHFGAICVRRCRIGANCSIGRLTSIGAAAAGPGPVIGDRVWIGAHVQIVGSWHVGRGATIGAGTIVMSDIPEGMLWLGNPGRPVVRNYDNRRMLGLREQPVHSVPEKAAAS